jgi:hypothetical protein
MGLLGNYYQQEQAAKTKQDVLDYLRETSNMNRADWLKYAFPSPQEITSERNMAYAKAGEGKNKAYENLASQSAKRGLGSGSGVIAKGGAEIEKGYQTRMGEAENALTKLQYTPRFGFPFANTSGAGAAAIASSGKWDNPLGLVLGQMLYKQQRNGEFGLPLPDLAAYFLGGE